MSAAISGKRRDGVGGVEQGGNQHFGGLGRGCAVWAATLALFLPACDRKPSGQGGASPSPDASPAAVTSPAAEVTLVNLVLEAGKWDRQRVCVKGIPEITDVPENGGAVWFRIPVTTRDGEISYNLFWTKPLPDEPVSITGVVCRDDANRPFLSVESFARLPAGEVLEKARVDLSASEAQQSLTSYPHISTHEAFHNAGSYYDKVVVAKGPIRFYRQEGDCFWYVSPVKVEGGEANLNILARFQLPDKVYQVQGPLRRDGNGMPFIVMSNYWYGKNVAVEAGDFGN